MTSPQPLAALELFRSMLPSVPDAIAQPQPKRRRQIYDPSLVMFLMMYQRLRAGVSMTDAISWMRLNLATIWPNESGCKRVVQSTVSANSGAFSHARSIMPTQMFHSMQDLVFNHLKQLLPSPAGQPCYVVDGTTLRLPHRPELVKAFPPGSNQHGDNHWPILQLTAFHDVHTGLAVHPRWGPMYGPNATGEVRMAIDGLNQLPAEAVVIADAGFGIFYFAYQVHNSQRTPLIRLTQQRATRILGEKLGKRMHRRVRWEPSAMERSKYPDLPPDAHLQGWLTVRPHPQNHGEVIILFTTAEWKAKKVMAYYKLRWNIETDLRHLKRTVNLHQLTSKSVAMIEKELLAGMVAYNLVCGVRGLVAKQAKLLPRQLSFSNTLGALQALPCLDPKAPPETHRVLLNLFVSGIIQTRLPKRRKLRSFPRAVWGSGGSFPSHGAVSGKGKPS